MASFNKILQKLFGSKAERDMKQIKPILDKVLASYSRIDTLTNDELRAESEKLKKIIADRIAQDETKKHELRAQLEDVEIAPEKKEALATEVDKLTKKIDEQIEEVLHGILPAAPAIVT